MVIIAMPQLEAEQDEVVAAGGGAAAGGAGVDAGGDIDDIDDIDDPPPQALKAAISKVHAAPGSHRRRVMDALVRRFERCMDVLPAIVVWVSAHLRGLGYLPAARRTLEIRETSGAWLWRAGRDNVRLCICINYLHSTQPVKGAKLAKTIGNGRHNAGSKQPWQMKDRAQARLCW
jgi:hypothetical protein